MSFGRHACRVCSGPTDRAYALQVLGRFTVEYRHCPRCDFFGTEQPYWLDEAYAEAVAVTDTGLVARNLLIADQLTCLLPLLSDPRNTSYVDCAGGYGLLVRLMRDRGFDFRWTDRYARNELARGFEWFVGGTGAPVGAATAVEVLEHTVVPVDFVDACLRDCATSTLVFTTVLHDCVPPSNWWYLSPETGQHVSFFSSRTLHFMAEQLGATVLSLGSLHVMSREHLPVGALRAAHRLRRLLLPVRARRYGTLTLTDRDQAVHRLRAGG